MREILLRGKRADTGEWIEGSLLKAGVESKTYCSIFGDNLKFTASGMKVLSHAIVDPETIGQYTGLTDKNGTRIFEGDIISAYLDDISPESETRLFVCWYDYGWHGKTKYSYETLESDWVNNYFEVIGNIHDNPELLKGD